MVKNGEKPQSMFLGEYRVSVTTGSRVAIPKPYRVSLGKGTLILTRGYEGCAVLVKKTEFEKLLSGLTELPFVSADKRETSRFLLAGAFELEPDEQGRVILPEAIKTHIRLKSEEIAFLGVGQWIEIWDLEAWNGYQVRLDAEAKVIADRLVNIQKT